jgi:hypothetical protein
VATRLGIRDVDPRCWRASDLADRNRWKPYYLESWDDAGRGAPSGAFGSMSVDSVCSVTASRVPTVSAPNNPLGGRAATPSELEFFGRVTPGSSPRWRFSGEQPGAEGISPSGKKTGRQIWM